MVIKASSQVDSGGRKLALQVEVVVNVRVPGQRERKLRCPTGFISETCMKEILKLARPKGRTRVRKKGKGCVERRKAARAKARKEGRVKLPSTAEEFSPACVAPPLPREPEPGSALYRAVAERLMAEIVMMPAKKDELDTAIEDNGDDGDGGEVFYDAR